MKHKIFLLLIITSFLSQKGKAQNNDASNAIAIGAAIGAAIISIEEYKEYLESEAVDYILSNHPEISKFRLKCLLKEGSKLSDQGETSAIVFLLTTLDEFSPSHERKVLVKFTNDDFVNEYGNTIEKVVYKIFDSEEWNSIMSYFGNLIGIGDSISLVNGNFLVPIYEQIDCEDLETLKSKNQDLATLKTNKCFVKFDEEFDISNVLLKKNGFVPRDSKTSKFIYPFHNIMRDDYIVGDYSNEFKVFSNENTIGLYVKSIGKSILLKRSLVRNIHSFIHFNKISNNSTKAKFKGGSVRRY